MKNLLIILWSHLPYNRKKQAFGLLSFSIITSFFEILTIGSIFPLLSTLLKQQKTVSFDLSKDFQFIQIFEFFKINSENIFIIFSILILIACLCRILLIWSMIRYSHAVGSDLGMMIFKKTLQQPLEYHLSVTTSEIISNLTKKIHILSLEIVHPIILVTSNMIIIMGVVLFITFSAGLNILAILFCIVCIFFVFWKLSKSTIQKNSNIIAKNSDELIKNINQTFGAIKLISMKQIYDMFTFNFDKVNRGLKYAEGDNVFLSQSIRVWIELIIVIAAILCFYIAFKMNVFMQLVPLLGGVTFAVLRIMPLINKAYSGFATIIGAKQSFFDIITFISLKNLNTDIKNEKLLNFTNKIVFKNVNYKYPHSNISSINQLKLVINNKSTTAIVGTTGSGKTTLLSLLIGLIQPTKGQIKIDNVILESNNLNAWKLKISYVPQETIIIDDTIINNIVLGDTNLINIQKVKKVLKLVNLEKFIPSIENDTMIGERGIKISGGERQRIGIARALYDDKDLLILDEPFSSLDKKTSIKILENIKKNTSLTIIIVTHDEFILPLCDNIIVLKDGKISN